jgi:ketosteroid isomerase-like protein
MQQASKLHIESFKEFMMRRKRASDAYANGDPGPVDDIATHVSPATFFGPSGDYVEGADKVNAVNKKGAESFEPGGENHLDILQTDASDHIGFWAGIQRSTVRMKGKEKPVTINLRVTEVFLRQEGEWKLVHRHADPLKENAH